MIEIWKDIDGYEGIYKVSNLGNVKSFRNNKQRAIAQWTSNCGYKQVSLWKDGKQKHYFVHRLVAKAFVDGFSNGVEVNHKDSNKQNNVFTNLEWVTKSENQTHQRKFHGTVQAKREGVCPVCGCTISSGAKSCRKHNRYLIQIEARKKWPSKDDLEIDITELSFVKIGEKYGYSDNMIRKICKEYGLPSKKNEVEKYILSNRK